MAHWIPVVALALRDASGRLLLQQRPAGKAHAGAWEFPGGKVEPGETPRAALVREIVEELGIILCESDLEPSLLAQEGEGPTIVLMLLEAERWEGQPQGLEGQEWGWFAPAEAMNMELAPMDRNFLLRMSH